MADPDWVMRASDLDNPTSAISTALTAHAETAVTTAVGPQVQAATDAAGDAHSDRVAAEAAAQAAAGSASTATTMAGQTVALQDAAVASIARDTSSQTRGVIDDVSASAGAQAAVQTLADNPDVIAQAAALAQSDAGLVRQDAVVASAPLVFTDEDGREVQDLRFDQAGHFIPEVAEPFRATVAPLARRITRVPRLVQPLDAETGALLKTTLLNAVRYMLVTWLPARFPGVDPITSLGGVDEPSVRHPCAAAFAVAVALDTGLYDDAVVGVSADDARAQVVRVVSAGAHLHKSVTAGGWGGGWQSSIWAANYAAAASCVWDALDSEVKSDVEAMLGWEANRFSSVTPPMWATRSGEVIVGDSKAEENAWNGNTVALAALTFPDNVNASGWEKAAYRWLLSSSITPSDITTGVRVQGALLCEEFTGWNVREDGGVINHGILHPDYMCSLSENQWAAGVMWGLRRGAIPAMFVHNAERVYFALTDVKFNGTVIYDPSGVINYPQGTDWGRGRYADKAMADVLAHCMGLDHYSQTPAQSWARLHLQRIADQQARFTSGQSYPDGTAGAAEDSYAKDATPPGREPWVARNLALAALASTLPVNTVYEYSDKEI